MKKLMSILITLFFVNLPYAYCPTGEVLNEALGIDTNLMYIEGYTGGKNAQSIIEGKTPVLLDGKNYKLNIFNRGDSARRNEITKTNLKFLDDGNDPIYFALTFSFVKEESPNMCQYSIVSETYRKKSYIQPFDANVQVCKKEEGTLIYRSTSLGTIKLNLVQ